MTRLLTSYAETNEFVCATLACDLDRMMSIVALGNGKQKTNAVDFYYDVSNKKRMKRFELRESFTLNRLF